MIVGRAYSLVQPRNWLGLLLLSRADSQSSVTPMVVRQWTIRLIVFIFLFGLMIACLAADIWWVKTPSQLVTERSYTESFQLLLLAASTILLLVKPGALRHGRSAVWTLAAICFAMLVREADHWLDRHAYDGAWQHLVTVGLAVLAYVLVRRRGELADSLLWYLQQPACTLLFTAFAMLVFSRLFGMGDLWQQVMGEGYIRSVKNVVEEGLESFAQVILALAVVETRLAAQADARR